MVGTLAGITKIIQPIYAVPYSLSEQGRKAIRQQGIQNVVKELKPGFTPEQRHYASCATST